MIFDKLYHSTSRAQSCKKIYTALLPACPPRCLPLDLQHSPPCPPRRLPLDLQPPVRLALLGVSYSICNIHHLALLGVSPLTCNLQYALPSSASSPSVCNLHHLAPLGVSPSICNLYHHHIPPVPGHVCQPGLKHFLFISEFETKLTGCSFFQELIILPGQA